MTNQNLLLQDDAFAPAAPDSMEHLPSHHCATTRKSTEESPTLKPCDCSPAKRCICDYCAGYGKDAAIEKVAQLKRRPNPAHGTPMPTNHKPFA